MKLIKLKQEKLVEEKAVTGLVATKIEYAVEEAKGKLEYTGPKLDPELWYQILSFFRWTYKEHQSECQVRLYVNVKLGRWAAWAFPQAAKTGMTARELPEQESEEKARERFAVWESEPSDDWLYFGTVHHHCSASAFQSSISFACVCTAPANCSTPPTRASKPSPRNSVMPTRFIFQGCFAR